MFYFVSVFVVSPSIILIYHRKVKFLEHFCLKVNVSVVFNNPLSTISFKNFSILSSFDERCHTMCAL